MLYPDFDDNLRQAFRREMELFFDSIVHEDRSVLDLLTADYTFVDERLAKHYGIPNVYGSQFRRVTLGPELDMRRGLLGKGALLTVTSQPARTSPVARGKWFLQTFLGVSPPDPPPNVPAVKPRKRTTPAIRKSRRCASGWSSIARTRSARRVTRSSSRSASRSKTSTRIGTWRTEEEGSPIDASGELVDGTDGERPGESARGCWCAIPHQFVRVVTEKLLTYALGRGVEYPDMPLVRSIVRDAAGSNYRFSSLVLGIVKSAPFQMNTKADPNSRRNRRLVREGDSHHVSYEEAHPPADLPARRGCDAGAAAARCDGAGPHAAGPDGGHPDAALCRHLCPARHGARLLGPEQGGHRLQVSVDLRAARTLPGAGDDSERAPCPVGGSAAGAEPRPTIGWRRRSCARTNRRRTAGADLYNGTTIDQLIAQKIGQDNLLPSLQLAVEDPGANSSNCGEGYSCAYTNSISWSTPTTPLPMELNPQVVFERMFGDGSTAEERAARRARNRSILDSLTGSLARLRADSAPADRSRLDEYADDVREIERRLQIAMKASAAAPAESDGPGGRAGIVRRTRQAAVRSAGAGLPGGHYARGHDAVCPRPHDPDSTPRAASTVSFHAGSHHGEDPKRTAGVCQGEPVSRHDAGAPRGEAGQDAPMATARCWTIR